MKHRASAIYAHSNRKDESDVHRLVPSVIATRTKSTRMNRPSADLIGNVNDAHVVLRIFPRQGRGVFINVSLAG